MDKKSATMLRIHANLKQARLNTGLTQEEFADKINTKRTTYREWEAKSLPGILAMLDISSFTGHDILEFITSEIKPGDKAKKLKPGTSSPTSELATLKATVKFLTLTLIESRMKETGKNLVECTREVEAMIKRELEG